MQIVLQQELKKYEPNTFIGGLSLSTKELLANEIDVAPSRVKNFNYDVINDRASAFIKGNFNIPNNKYYLNNEIIEYDTVSSGSLGNIFVFRLANEVIKINLPNKTGSTGTIANSYMFQCAKLESLILSSITRLQHNFIASAPNLTELDVSSVVYADTKSIRGIPLIEIIDLKKCKYLGTDGHEPSHPIFTGLNPNVTINLNYALMTSNDGDVDAHVVGLKVAYPNCTINFYDDDGIFVETYNPNPELYTQNDACSIGANETESIGAGWALNAQGSTVQHSIVLGNHSNYAHKFILSTANSSRAELVINGLEIGAEYRITCDCKMENNVNPGLGEGWFRTKDNGSWNDSTVITIDSEVWETKWMENIAASTTVTLQLFPSRTSSGNPTLDVASFIDNISIKKIS